jgi:hypothetical protein
MKKLIIFTILWLTSWVLFTQECNDLGESVMPSRSFELRSPQVWNVPISIKLVQNDLGYSETTQEQIYEQIEIFNANSAYVNLVVVEYIEIQNTNWFVLNDVVACADQFQLRDAYTNPNTLNSFIVGTLKSCSSGSNICGEARYPSNNQYNWVNFMSDSCVNNGSTYPHEWGHNFNNRHTHSSSELIDRSNCTTAGDDYCDTPASPTLSTGNVVSTSGDNPCTYVGSATDGNGWQYRDAESYGFEAPDPTNFMGYGWKDCRTHFTTEQQLDHEATAAFYCQTLNCNSLSTVQQSIQKTTVIANPFNDYITLSSKVEYKLFDLTGKLLLLGNNNSIRTSSLPKGIYLLKIGQDVYKVIK